ncbi:MAG TPA: murein L,D-transpeptidase catalytic domain family protein [Vicinamibacterales bacterium]|nr:murein L,D-transpeptidase catalytic domain family protein [Vicinamibacterales bacterium]
MKKGSLLAAVVAAVALTITPALGTARASAVAATATAAANLNAENWDPASLGGIDPQVFEAAMNAAAAAVERGRAKMPATLTIIDFTRPSTEKRLWVYDLTSHALLFDEWVAHGRGSGKTMASAFSNRPDSNMSSLGLFRTAEAYEGHNGYSLRLDGLDPGVNDNARERAIVIHGAPYVNPITAHAQGYLGRSLGCPAVRPEVAHALIDAVKGGGLLFAYGG